MLCIFLRNNVKCKMQKVILWADRIIHPNDMSSRQQSRMSLFYCIFRIFFRTTLKSKCYQECAVFQINNTNICYFQINDIE